MSEKVVLVTGGAGFVGSSLIRGLLATEEDIQVVSVDNYFTGSAARHVRDPRARYVHGNTIDVIALWDDLRLGAPTTVYHLGEYSRIPQSFDEPDRVWEYNLRGTKEVVRLCRRFDAKLVYAASSSKFGNDGRDENLTPYSWTKAKNVEFIKNTHEWFGFDHVITYCYNVYGPGQISTGPYATVIGIFEEQFRAGRPLTVAEPGTQSRDFTHVDDIVKGLILCAERGFGDGYLLGRGEELQILDAARMFGADITMIPPRRGERHRGLADTSQARSIGWEPTISLADYVAEFVKNTAVDSWAAGARHGDPQPVRGTP
jgi:UDP-glucose 4-epimerase